MSSLEIVGIDSKQEAATILLSQLPLENITRIVVILYNEPNPVTFDKPADLQSFYEKNAGLCLSYRDDYACYQMPAGAGGKIFSTVMVYAEGEPEAYTLVADLETHADEGGFPFGGQFTAGPFKTMEAAETFAVNMLVREGVAVEVNQEEGDAAWRLRSDLDPDEELFSHRSDLLDAWRDCLEGLEWYHIFPSLRVPAPAAEPAVLPSNAHIEQL